MAATKRPRAALAAAAVLAAGAGAGALVATGATAATKVDPRAIPLGDGKVATSPQRGSTFSCTTRFSEQGGASSNVPWIHGSTWDSTQKLHVQGQVRWSGAFSLSTSNGRRVLRTNDVPSTQATGTFPVSSSDPAYRYDRNPNSIRPRSATLSLPQTPKVTSTPSCVPMGAIGVMLDGVYLFNGLDAGGRDAAAHEVLDACDGHPERSGAYHHHSVGACQLARATGSSTLVGYALDGFGIYVERNADGSLPTNGDLDVCHGRTSTVAWDGRRVSMYHYVATTEYPYVVGCFRGTPTSAPQ